MAAEGRNTAVGQRESLQSIDQTLPLADTVFVPLETHIHIAQFQVDQCRPGKQRLDIKWLLTAIAIVFTTTDFQCLEILEKRTDGRRLVKYQQCRWSI